MFTAQRISPSHTAVAQPATAGKPTPFFQPKLTVNTPGDVYEQEADRVADQVMRMKAPPLSPQGGATVQRMPITPLSVQRKCAHCEKEEKAMRKETGGGASGQAAPAAVSDVLSSGSGQPMDAGTRQWAESRFGQDFSQVRVHTDARAADSAAAIQARAYTSGSNVVFGAGEYQPQSEGGQRLLAHELVHVGQQKGSTGSVQRSWLSAVGLGAGAAAVGAWGGTELGPSLGLGKTLGGILGGALGLGVGLGLNHLLTKEDFPWMGVVSGTSPVKLWSIENKGVAIGDLPQGTRITVLDRSGDNLKVRAFLDGVQKLGYVGAKEITKTGDQISGTTDELESLSTSQQNLTWFQSGPISERPANAPVTTFAEWATAPSEGSAPPLKESTVINCWEIILLAAYRAGTIDWKYIHSLYQGDSGDLLNDLVAGDLLNYRPEDAAGIQPAKGDFVLFNGLAHVGMATGNGNEIYSFWPAPDVNFNTKTVKGKVGVFPTPDKLKKLTIQTITDWWKAEFKKKNPVLTTDLALIQLGKAKWSGSAYSKPAPPQQSSN